jgi:hypothetical protein
MVLFLESSGCGFIMEKIVLMRRRWKKLLRVCGNSWVTEFVATFLMVIGLACVIRAIPAYSGMQTAFMLWLAFVLPTMASTVIWWADTKKYMATKIAVSSICRLIGLLATAYVLAM